MASSICSARRAWLISSLGGDERHSTPHSRSGWQARRRPGRRRSGCEPDQSQKTGSRPRSRAGPVRRRSPGEAATAAARKRRASAVACGHSQPRRRPQRRYPPKDEWRCRPGLDERRARRHLQDATRRPPARLRDGRSGVPRSHECREAPPAVAGPIRRPANLEGGSPLAAPLSPATRGIRDTHAAMPSGRLAEPTCARFPREARLLAILSGVASQRECRPRSACRPTAFVPQAD